MTFSKKNFIYNVSIYYRASTFYVVGLVRKPPYGLSIEVLPVFTSQDNNIKQLAHAIELAKVGSDMQYPSRQSHLERQRWDGENEQVWNNATHSWSVYWEEDGNVTINPLRPIKHKNGVEWRVVPELEKVLPSPVSASDIAKEIINQTVNN